jgi:hypothetical protein
LPADILGDLLLSSLRIAIVIARGIEDSDVHPSATGVKPPVVPVRRCYGGHQIRMPSLGRSRPPLMFRHWISLVHSYRSRKRGSR